MSIPVIRRRGRTIFAVIWLIVALVGFLAWWQSGLSLRQLPFYLEEWLQRFGIWKAAALYILFYTVRPLLLFPASVLTVVSGLVFGPWLGILFTIIGENASANVAFFLARWLGRDLVAVRQREGALAAQWDERLRRNGLLAVLIMRLVYLPFDLVNFACGLTSMRQIDFAIGTFIGILPPLVSFVLFGGVAAADNPNRMLTLGLAFAFFFLGLVLARALRKYKPPGEIDDDE